jgi:plastocyanin domain-containing protein
MKSILGIMAGLTVLAGCAGPSGKSTAGTEAGPARVTITVTEKGYEPEVVTVAAGQPVTLVVTRTTAQTCATEIVMAEHGINQPLPLGQSVEITFTPTQAGELTYACAMDMYKGKIVVK